jgi:hypothetical protein
MQRTARRWHESKGLYVKKRVIHAHADGTFYYRKVNKRVQRLTNQGGFLAIPDGMTELLLRALEAHNVPETSKRTYETRKTKFQVLLEKLKIQRLTITRTIIMATLSTVKTFVSQAFRRWKNLREERPP